MKDAALWIVGTGAVLLLAARRGGSVQQPSGVESSLAKLVPAFRERVQQLLVNMRAEGLRPIVWETYRSPARATALAKAGMGVALSQHTLGLAVDILDGEKRWDAPPAFWDALHRHALALGLGRVKRRNKLGDLEWDLPHVQATPGEYDARMRALATEAAREEFLRARYA